MPRSYKLLVNGLPEKGKPTITTVGEASEPLNLITVIQLGPSMSASLPIIQQEIVALVGRIPQTSNVRVIGFADKVISDSNATTPAEARKAVEGLSIRSEALVMELADSVKKALTPPAGKENNQKKMRTVLIVIGDGTARDLSRGRFAEIGFFASERSIPIHTVGYVPIDDVPLRTTLAVLSQKSRGTERAARSEDELKDVLTALNDEIVHQRILEYQLPRVFTGQQYDFQVMLGDVASEPIAKLVPKAEIETPSAAGPIVLVLVIFIGIAGAGYGVMAARKKKREKAKAIMKELQESASPAGGDLGETIPGLQRDVLTKGEDLTKEPDTKEIDLPEPKPEPKPVAKAEPKPEPKPEAKPRPKPEPLVKPEPKPKPKPKPKFEIPQPQEKEEEGPPAKFAVLPSPTEFLHAISAADVAKAKAGVQIVETAEEVTAEDESPKFDDSNESSSSDPAEAIGGTQVMSTNELDSVDVAGWLVPLPDGPTVVLKDGFTIGATEVADHQVEGEESLLFNQDNDGRFKLEDRFLEDGDVVTVSGKQFLYKFAARFKITAAAAHPYLQVIGGLDDGRRFEMGPGLSVVLGTDPKVDAELRGAGVAPRHAVARVKGEVCEVADLGDPKERVSYRGKTVGLASLAPDDEVLLGSVRLVFRVPS